MEVSNNLLRHWRVRVHLEARGNADMSENAGKCGETRGNVGKCGRGLRDAVNAVKPAKVSRE